MPLYDQILEDILAKIQNGELVCGDMLPKEIDIAAAYGVSRPTVRTALLKLVEKGYLTRSKGQGTFVTRPKLAHSYTRFVESYNEEMKRQGLTPQTIILELSVQNAGERVADKLRCDEKTQIIKLRRLRYARPIDERPIVLTTVYIPLELLPNFKQYNFETVSLYDALEKQGVQVKTSRRELEIRTLYGRSAMLLSAKDGSVAHFVSSVGFDANGRPAEYSESFYPADRNKFIIEVFEE